VSVDHLPPGIVMPSTNQGHYLQGLRFSWLTPCYDLLCRTIRELEMKQALVAQADLGSAERLLDLGCGTGTLLVMIRQAFPGLELVGVDADAAMLAIASRKARAAGGGIHFDRALARRLPYRQASFDRVVSSLFFHHLPWGDKQQAAAEIWRILRPGGELHVADWGKPAGALMRLCACPVQWLDGFAATRDNLAGRLPELFAEAGFNPVAQTGQLNTLFGTLALYRAVKPSRP